VPEGVLIISPWGDYHGHAVSYALDAIGVPNYIWAPPDFPTRRRLSIHAANDLSTCLLKGISTNENVVSSESFSLVWLRREGRPVLPEGLHASDVEVAKLYCEQMLSAVTQLVSKSAICVNPYFAKRLANCKPLQLDAARDAGFRIPRTLVSNSPVEVSEFVSKLRGKVIVKSFSSHTWINEGKGYIQLTSPFNLKDFTDPRSIEAAPMIYQEKIEIVSELRVFVFGDNVYALKRDVAPDHIGKYTDLRAAPAHVTKQGLTELDAKIKARCIDVLTKLGLQTGSFDLAIADSNEWVFLEVNEGGQFLFIESEYPESGLLLHFASWLAELAGYPVSPHMKKILLSEFRHSEQWKDICRATNEHVEFSGAPLVFEA
jgi:glutathione synthase/RimK-type ligase-like ATP-grasp enzyme